METRRVRVRVRVKKARSDPILIASRQKLFAQAIGHALEAEGMDVVAIASTGAEALAHAACGAVTTALIDLDLPDAEGVDIGRELLSRYPGILVIAMSDPLDLAKASDALASGFGGFLSRTMDVKRLLSEIDSRADEWVLVEDVSGSPAGSAERALGDGATAEDAEETGELLEEGATAEEMERALNAGENSVISLVWRVLSRLETGSSRKWGPLGRGNHYPRYLRSN